ncbi:LapA family protein [Amycolatopsis rhabdoformis]|uniref:LapA family protein n=1 Tax=Amycolatopsis rhabdoformis TaxID=1448059 RepID=A0ABZ1HZP4_9PSEU|nr:LapA family protein [Amycolatopsis rhabdoformis]WSE27615.1 LapA family protein [Amycolatopsis rhabdoformis]
MLWLFGQIWLWLLVAFLLGALVMWLIMRVGRPKRAAEPARAAADPGAFGAAGTSAAARTSGTLPVAAEEPSEAERTQYIPVTAYDYNEQPERVYNDYPEVDPDEPYAPDEPSGHRIGRLPDPEPHLSGDLNWPAEKDPADSVDQWPHDDEPHESAPRRPGRGG